MYAQSMTVNELKWGKTVSTDIEMFWKSWPTLKLGAALLHIQVRKTSIRFQVWQIAKYPFNASRSVARSDVFKRFIKYSSTLASDICLAFIVILFLNGLFRDENNP